MDFSKTFSDAKSFILNNAVKILPINCGLPENKMINTNQRYVVSLHAEGSGINFTVHAFLQEKFNLQVSSDWTGLPAIPGVPEVGAFADMAVQGTTGLSLASTITSRRKWSGSKPIQIKLKLYFEAMNDVFKEVIQPCIGLQALVLPTRSGVSVAGNDFLLRPPGPNPWAINETTDTVPWINSERIEVNIGSFVVFKSVIVKDVSVTYGTKMTTAGPNSAVADVTIETYEMLTRDDLERAYSLAEGSINNGEFGFSTTQQNTLR